MTRASIVIPSHSGAQRLPRLLDGLAAQTYDDWEAVVVLDGDVDGSRAVVAAYESRIPLRCIAFDGNRGRVPALNAGFGAAEGDVLIRCDDDFDVDPGYVQAHVDAHDDRECGVIGPVHNVAPEGDYLRVYGRDADARGRRDIEGLSHRHRWRAWGGNTSVSRDAWTALHGFDERYRGYGWEDIDFGYRLHRRGVPIDYVEAAGVRHHLASVSARTRSQRSFRSGQARRTFDRAHHFEPQMHGSGPWNLAVGAVARGLTYERTLGLGSAIDAVLPHTPAPIGRKLVALLVEGAALAGYRVGESHVNDF